LADIDILSEALQMYCWLSSEKKINFAIIYLKKIQIQLSTYRIWRIRKN
jgi:hypothetical protein